MTIHGAEAASPTTDSGNATIIVPVPAETVDGDTMLLFLMYDQGSCEPASITGWTILGDGASTTTANVPAYSIWQRTASSEPGSYTATLGTTSSMAAGFIVAGNMAVATAFNSRHDENRQNDGGGAKTDTRALTHDGGLGSVGGIVFYMNLIRAQGITSKTLTPDPAVTVIATSEQISEGSPPYQQSIVQLCYQNADDAPASSWDYAFTDTFHSGSVCMVIEFTGWIDVPAEPEPSFSFSGTKEARPVFIKALTHQTKTIMLGG